MPFADGALSIAFQEVFGERFQGDGAAFERFQRFVSLACETRRNFPGFAETDECRVGCFLGGNIFAGGFAELLSGLGDIENVVDNLESKADIISEIGKRFELGIGTISAHPAKAHRTP